MTVTRDALLIEEDPNRSPSPPPKYDSTGSYKCLMIMIMMMMMMTVIIEVIL